MSKAEEQILNQHRETPVEGRAAHQEAVVSSRHAQHCLVCGQDRSRVVRQAKDWYRVESSTIYQLAKCLSCGLVSQKPLPSDSDLLQAYSIPYLIFRPAWKTPGWPLWKVLRLTTVTRRLLRLRIFSPGRELLEVGCGAGDFLLASHRAGWRVRGVEYDAAVADEIRKELGIDVWNGQLSPGLWQKGTFDVVVFWDVLEHLADPFSSLSMVSDYLRPGGAVLLSFPTVDSVEQGKRFGDFWALLDLPRHLYFFNRATLSRVCSKAGLDLVYYWTPLMDTLWCYFASAWRHTTHSGGMFSKAVRFVGWVVVIMLYFPYLVVRSWRGHGPQAVAVASKRSKLDSAATTC